MTETGSQPHRSILQRIARQAMLERGLLPDFSSEVWTELGKLHMPAHTGQQARDLKHLAWASIDNDNSRDLDQLSVAESMPRGRVKLLVAVADVESLVKHGSAIDQHAGHNTTSVYTPAGIFPMLPEKLSTDLTSLNFHEERLSIIVEMQIDADGSLQEADIYPACVRNQAKLSYNSVAPWLEGSGTAPEALAGVHGLDENLRLQDKVAQKLKNFRHVHGALQLETVQARPVFAGNEIRGLDAEKKNRAKEMIEDFMIAANGVTARYLSSKKFPSVRRVVRAPKRWDRIVELAAQKGFKLPDTPDSKALETFLAEQKTHNPVDFADLSLSVIKLIGAGEYVAEVPGESSPGHFGLAVRDYTHSTAPNRRYTDLITQRLLKAAMQGKPAPYTLDELQALAKHCTEEEDAAGKVERRVGKSAAALLLESRIGEQFEAIVTGAAPKGTWVRLLNIPVEGKLVYGFEGLDVGNRLRVQLVSTNVEQGFIDFKHIHRSKN
jgi:exoribonuclease-2